MAASSWDVPQTTSRLTARPIFDAYAGDFFMNIAFIGLGNRRAMAEPDQASHAP
jgi:hypothetical protein